jgi:hypothetical protein
MENTDEPSFARQNRGAFRTSLSPLEIKISRVWIHESESSFREGLAGPLHAELSLKSGVSLLNVSAGGALVRVDVSLETDLFSLLEQVPAEANPKAGNKAPKRQGTPPFRDASMVLELNLKEMRDILVWGKVMRASMIRGNAQARYELALAFYNWGCMTGRAVQWHKVRDGHVPPMATWITRRQATELQKRA